MVRTPAKSGFGLRFAGTVLLWATAVGGGMFALTRYQMSPGPAAAATADWPRGATPAPATDKPTLVMFLHPQCPCSAATVEELARLMTQCRDRVRVQVFVARPLDKDDDWSHTRLWNAAAAIPGVSVATDIGGAEAARFGARTSGQVFLYDARGRLLFDGGITGSRGHAGGNAGSDAVVQILLRPDGAANAAPVKHAVFGCALMLPAATADSRSPGDVEVLP